MLMRYVPKSLNIFCQLPVVSRKPHCQQLPLVLFSVEQMARVWPQRCLQITQSHIYPRKKNCCWVFQKSFCDALSTAELNFNHLHMLEWWQKSQQRTSCLDTLKGKRKKILSIISLLLSFPRSSNTNVFCRPPHCVIQTHKVSVCMRRTGLSTYSTVNPSAAMLDAQSKSYDVV